MDIIRFSIITPNYNGAVFLEETLKSVISQRGRGVELEYIVVDGDSRDHSHEILSRYRGEISRLLIEPDTGPANAINKGLALATGEIVAWLNGDDRYFPLALQRAEECLARNPAASFCFGSCPIVDAGSSEIRQGITHFKEFFFPLSSRFTYQCINYISQPAVFFRRSALERAGGLREDLQAAWDYEFILRLWRLGGGVRIPGGPVAAFRWHEGSISGLHFGAQFREEFQAAARDAGWFSPQALIHYFVRWGIVSAYFAMAGLRRLRAGETGTGGGKP